ncbi:hypothetical protein DAEQUDRAFT_130211 [Daedalea quercina L-15889]|uniref:Uncharacterized protein n=1 Tax=Daedalea quercina L-15889 TaxID=1314783 RepID=A0A165S1J2_9APHY|nr:hypothetical protein DAEQUDRAFT_130211 [Daedalea quercina L-15889]
MHVTLFTFTAGWLRLWFCLGAGRLSTLFPCFRRMSVQCNNVVYIVLLASLLNVHQHRPLAFDLCLDVRSQALSSTACLSCHVQRGKSYGHGACLRLWSGRGRLMTSGQLCAAPDQRAVR